MARSNDLGRDAVGPLLFRLALPAMVAQLVNALYNIVDRIYIGHIAGYGDLALTAVGVTFPIIMLISALASLVGMGGSARAAIAMGEGNLEKADKILGGCAAMALAIGTICIVVFEIFRIPLLFLFGASADTIGYASSYLGIYLLGSLFVLLNLGLNYFITFQGFSSIAMKTVIIGAVVNLALDPVFIFLFKMGVSGAAVATVIAQGVSCAWVLRFLLGSKSKLHIRRSNLALKKEIVVPVVSLGISPFTMHSTESLLMIAFNSSLQHYGGDVAVGAITICYSVMSIFSMAMQGIVQGAQPIISFNYGSGQIDRVKRAFSILIRVALIISVTICLLVVIFPGSVVAIFNDNPALTQAATQALRVYGAGLFVLGIQFPCQQAFLALSQAKVSFFLAILRKMILLIPLILIFPRVLPFDPVFSIFLAEPISDILAATTTGSVFAYKFPRILRERKKLLSSDNQE